MVQCLGIFDGISSGGCDWTIDRNHQNGLDKIVDAVRATFSSTIRGNKRVWMPIPTRANAQLAFPSTFEIETTGSDDVTILGKCFADGAIVPRGEIFGITSADCPTVIAWDRQRTHLWCFHAARDSLFDRKYILEGTKSREHCSVVAATVDAMQQQGVRSSDMYLHVCCGIRTGFLHPPSHVLYGTYNTALLEACEAYGAITDYATSEIDLFLVIRGQAVELGVPASNISVDCIDTFRDTDGKGHFLWASSRCEKRKHLRNLVLVYHRS